MGEPALGKSRLKGGSQDESGEYSHPNRRLEAVRYPSALAVQETGVSRVGRSAALTKLPIASQLRAIRNRGNGCDLTMRASADGVVCTN